LVISSISAGWGGVLGLGLRASAEPKRGVVLPLAKLREFFAVAFLAVVFALGAVFRMVAFFT
jgi:preprotein translocase subunit SecG